MSHSHGAGHGHRHGDRPGRSDAPPIPDFDGARRELVLYHRALCGRGCELVPYDDDRDLRQHPDTASTVRLPSHVPAVPEHWTGDSAWWAERWYRVAITHRALHHDLGTFDGDLDADEPLFERRRPSLGSHPEPALEQFVRLFGRTALAVEVLATLEDLRVDAVALHRLPGLATDYVAVLRSALADRPDPSGLAPRAAVAEALVRLSLGAAEVRVDPAVVPAVAFATSVARRLRDPAASVASSAEAAIRIYSLLAGLPNIGAGATPATVRFDGLAADPEAPEHAGIRQELRLEGDEIFDVRFVPVRFRDVPGPRYLGQAASGMPLQEAILRTTTTGAEGSPNADEDGFMAQAVQAERGDVDVTAVERPEAPPEPLPHDHGPDLENHHRAAEGAVHARSRTEHVYPEWDSVAGRYRADWCLLREREPLAATSGWSHRRVLATHGHLLPGLVWHLRQMRPEGRDLALRQPYGDDLDLDACIDARIDLRTGIEPSPHVYSSFHDTVRDVAVAIAVDLSSSTAERLPASGPGAPVSRILDLQRDAVTLLAEALDRVGDDYGIYGFSGTGRADVRLSVVKDLDQGRSPTMLHRLRGLRPDHTTRMAPAIRHLTRRLLRHPSGSRILLLVSDGRPFDLDYGQQYGEDAVVDYALADTGRALEEARARGVAPFLVTVDAEGEDYLARICHPREYHVIDDARQLPDAIAELYLVARRDVRFRRARRAG